MEFLYYPGCTMTSTAKYLDRCARAAASALGITLAEVEDWQCCGAVFPLGKDEIAPKLAAMRVLAQARDKGKVLVTLCSACHHVLKQVNHQAKNDADFCAAVSRYDNTLVYAGEAVVKHYIEVIKEYIGFDKLKEKVKNPLKGRKIGVYYGCLLLRPPEVMCFDDAENPRIFEDMVKALGGTAVTFPMRNECCGGYRAAEDEGACAVMAARVAESAAQRGADTLAAACPLCLYQLVAHSGGLTDVCYFTELLAEALDVLDEGDDD
jgi:heterodisulfide reductase subunit B